MAVIDEQRLLDTKPQSSAYTECWASSPSSASGVCTARHTTSLGLCGTHYEEITGRDAMEDPMKYLIDTRGIDPIVAEYADWGREGDEYVIPYFDAFGRRRTWRYHNPGGKPKYRTRAGDQPHLYCVENVRFGQVILAEGEIDTLSVLSVDLKAVGVAGANSFFAPWFHLLEHVDELIVAFDGDDAGRQAASKIKSKFPQARVVKMPDGKDLNDILRGAGPEALRALLLSTGE